MSKLTILVVCAVAVSLNSVYADENEREAFHAVIRPYVAECSKEFSISEADLMKLKETHRLDSLEPCFVGCVFKKFGIINDKGEYDSEVNLAKIKLFVKNEDRMAAMSKIAKNCESINAEAVSDGDAGCERSVLLRKCFIAQKSEIPL